MVYIKQTCEAANLGINIALKNQWLLIGKKEQKWLKYAKKKVKLYVVKQNRFNKTLQLLKSQIDSGRFGKLSLVTLNVFWQRHKNIMIKVNGEYKELDGGALMNQASHYVDLLDWLIGPVFQLNAYAATLGKI